ncbi:hypothetical protein Tco_0891915 [Tanacetum coccineum]|uniref:Uncharacterized protein n=1 Tax=Tanacetum coccineum TaxID=301880 RepID=A0ABQ5C7I2_9ASTR
MNEAVKVVVQLQSYRLREEDQAENEDFLNKIDENIKKIIKEQVKVQVKEHVSKIWLRIEKSVNEHLKAKVLIRSSNEAKTSYAVAANLSEIELKKILIDKMENNKSIDISVQQKTLYKALVDAYEADNDILATYGDTTTLKRHQDDEDEDKEPSAGSNRGSKRRRKEDLHESFNELMDTPLDFSAFVLNLLKVDTLTPELLAGPTFELMKGSCKSLKDSNIEGLARSGEEWLERVQWTNSTRGSLSGAWDRAREREVAQMSENEKKRSRTVADTASNFSAFNREFARDVYPKNKIIRIKKLTIVEWHNYKHLEWITVRRDDDKLYTFKEGNYNRLRLQDIEDMLLLLVQGKLKNLNIKEHKKNRLMRIDELYKFSDGTLNDVRSALDDTLKKIRMKYLPHTIWKKVVRHRYSNPVIQPELERSTQGYPLVSVEVLRSILMDSNVTPTKHGRITKPYSSPRFIANYFNIGYLNMEVKWTVQLNWAVVGPNTPSDGLGTAAAGPGRPAVGMGKTRAAVGLHKEHTGSTGV